MLRGAVILTRSFGTQCPKITNPLVENCRNAIHTTLRSKTKSWVLFENQTVVMLDENASSMASASEKATQIMRDYGPVDVGTPAGDFNVVSDALKGWIVTTGHCENMFTYVDKRQANHGEGVMIIGLLGRGMRGRDGKNPNAIHVELANEATVLSTIFRQHFRLNHHTNTASVCLLPHSEDDFRSGCRNVSCHQQSFSRLPTPPGRSHNSNVIYCYLIRIE